MGSRLLEISGYCRKALEQEQRVGLRRDKQSTNLLIADMLLLSVLAVLL